MGGLMDLFQQISTSVKLGWIVCLVWAVVQIAWYRHARLDRERSRVSIQNDRAARFNAIDAVQKSLDFRHQEP